MTRTRSGSKRGKRLTGPRRFKPENYVHDLSSNSDTEDENERREHRLHRPQLEVAREEIVCCPNVAQMAPPSNLVNAGTCPQIRPVRGASNPRTMSTTWVRTRPLANSNPRTMSTTWVRTGSAIEDRGWERHRSEAHGLMRQVRQLFLVIFFKISI